MDSSTQPIGIVYPLPSHLIDRFFKDKKSVFVKFPTHETISSRLRGCEKLIFYKSKSGWELVGEAKIDDVSLRSIQEVLSNFKEELFLSEEEFKSYAKSRNNKKVLVFKLSRPITYQRPVKLDHYVTMTGEYISVEDYHRLISP
jgi:hypothetical protein